MAPRVQSRRLTVWADEILEQLQVFVAIIDATNMLLVANRVAREVLGVRPGERLSTSLAEPIAAVRLHGRERTVPIEHSTATWLARLTRMSDGVVSVVAERTHAGSIPATQLADLLNIEVPDARLAHMVSRGLTNDAIAERLGVPVTTVKNRIWRLYRKLGVKNRAELTALVLSGQRPAPLSAAART